MRRFEMNMLPWNVVFGAGSLGELPDRLDLLGYKHVLVLATPEQTADAERIATLIGARAAGRFCEARMHVPVATAEAALAHARECGADSCISIGGGSTTGLGKALALNGGLPFVAIPTTYAGSEMTSIWGMTRNGRKQTGRDLNVLPKLTIYDAELTLGLPPKIAGPSGMNAMAQAVINAKDERTNPVIRSMALEAIGAIAHSLPVVMREPDNIEARENVQYGAALAGASLGAGVTSLHHKLCHTLGGSFDTPHAETHTILLPYSVAYAAPAVPDNMARIADALGAGKAAAGLWDLAHGMGLPVSLADIGIGESDLERIADIATENAIVNPRPVTREGVLELLRNALAGTRPAA